MPEFTEKIEVYIKDSPQPQRVLNPVGKITNNYNKSQLVRFMFHIGLKQYKSENSPPKPVYAKKRIIGSPQ